MVQTMPGNSRLLDRLPMVVLRCLAVVTFIAAFVAPLNPARLSERINQNASLFTSTISYSTTGSEFIRALDRGWIEQSALTFTYIGALITGLAVAIIAAAFCLSLGKIRMERLSVKIMMSGALAGLAGMGVLRLALGMMEGTSNLDHVKPMNPGGITAFTVLFAAALLVSAAAWLRLPKAVESDRYEIEPKYRLFLMILPFLVLVGLFSYLPLWFWRVSFYDNYIPGVELASEDFVGLKWLRFLFGATRHDILRVLKNTFVMSGIGLATAWLPMMFAIFLSELRFKSFKRGVQTLTTIPNFISWVLVYSVAFAVFSTEGFLNWMLESLGVITEGSNYLLSDKYLWLKMWLYGTWKGLGWSAIIYIAGISSIDPQLHEAATVDGAGRFRRMWHVTVPGLMSTFFVLLLLGISNILSNGMDQYLVFENHSTRSAIEVLDLYVYNIGLGRGSNIPLATLVGMLKSIISVTLLFAANRASKSLRGESIV
ncbi:MAG: ABC transporter permease subunit [Oscillospiraceae bacterium]|nr:ABC transporter permease subunit [Oscillospiraceae bacterium]